MSLCQGFLIAWALPTFNSMAITDTTELLSARSMSKSGKPQYFVYCPKYFLRVFDLNSVVLIKFI